jgi:two-component system KDP operon response regulator KdpE
MTAHILLVEDQELNRSLVRAILARAKDRRVSGADLTEAHDLGAARRAVAEQDFHIVLLDIQLPDGSGLTLLEDLNGRGEARPAVIALTGGVLPHQRAAALDAGCDEFLNKPFRSQELLELLEKYLPA